MPAAVGDDVLAGGDRAGQRHHAHLVMPGQPIADAGAAAEQHVEHARREQPGGQFGQFESGQRRLPDGLITT